MRHLIVFVALVSLAACSVGHADRRVAYWQSLTAQQLPPGSTLDEATQLFSSHGLDLHCCVSGPDIDKAYYAMEKNVGRLLWMQYDVMVVVDISAERRVEGVKVVRLGVGL
jgi:hypothetical protein